MKKISFLIIAAALVLSACGSKKDGNNNSNPAPIGPNSGQAAAVELPLECRGPQQNYQQLPQWNSYEAAGCSSYNWDNGGHFRRGGCPSGTFAACALGAGMVCMPSGIYREYQVAWYNYSDNNPQMSFCGYEGYGQSNRCSYRGMPGAGLIGTACLVGEANTCGDGVCQPIDNDRRSSRGNRRARTHSHSRIGVCIQGF